MSVQDQNPANNSTANSDHDSKQDSNSSQNLDSSFGQAKNGFKSNQADIPKGLPQKAKTPEQIQKERERRRRRRRKKKLGSKQSIQPTPVQGTNLPVETPTQAEKQLIPSQSFSETPSPKKAEDHSLEPLPSLADDEATDDLVRPDQEIVDNPPDQALQTSPIHPDIQAEPSEPELPLSSEPAIKEAEAANIVPENIDDPKIATFPQPPSQTPPNFNFNYVSQPPDQIESSDQIQFSDQSHPSNQPQLPNQFELADQSQFTDQPQIIDQQDFEQPTHNYLYGNSDLTVAPTEDFSDKQSDGETFSEDALEADQIKQVKGGNQIDRASQPEVGEDLNKAMVSSEAIHNIIDEKAETESLDEDKTILDKFLEGVGSLMKKITSFLNKNKLLGAGGTLNKERNNFGNILNYLKKLIWLLILLGLILGAYLLGASLHLTDYISNFFTPKPEQRIEVQVNPIELNQWGITTVELFAQNQGSLMDRLSSSIRNIDFFGQLSEPIFMGQTGISAATYYGFLRDDLAATSQFIGYLSLLNQLQNLYQIDIYQLLDRNSQRNATLNNYLVEARAGFDEGTQTLRTIGVQLDDLRISYNSLNPEKERYEVDFFAALEGFAGERADFLLKSFIDVSQKQVSLRSRINALERLIAYYEVALPRLSRRIEAIEKNREALINGIRVVEIPGSNVDLIIRPEG